MRQSRYFLGRALREDENFILRRKRRVRGDVTNRRISSNHREGLLDGQAARCGQDHRVVARGKIGEAVAAIARGPGFPVGSLDLNRHTAKRACDRARR